MEKNKSNSKQKESKSCSIRYISPDISKNKKSYINYSQGKNFNNL